MHRDVARLCVLRNLPIFQSLVLRWEYVRGSTLFVVWNMATSDESRAGQFSAGRDLQTAFGAPGNHVFVVKLNYWLSL